MKGFRIITAVAAALMLSATVFADENRNNEGSGYVTGSFETNTNVYLKDAKTLATVPDGRFGSNN